MIDALFVKIPATRTYHHEKDEFGNDAIYFDSLPEITIELCHSLISITKWEEKYKKSFLEHKNFTNEEFLYYIKCMCITKNVSDETFYRLTNQNSEDIWKYIQDVPSALNVKKQNDSSGSREPWTNEVIYYYLAQNGITDFRSVERWHINRVLKLLEFASAKNAKAYGNNSVKESKADISRRYRALNEANRRKFNTKG